MSLSRVSYLESWEHQPPPFIRYRGGGGADSGAEDNDNDEASPSLNVPNAHYESEGDDDQAALFSSSFPSTVPARSIRHKLTFNPVAGRGWTHSSVVSLGGGDEETRSLLGSGIGSVTNFSELGASVRATDDQAVQEIGFKDPNWNLAETIPAFEVSKAKRVVQVIVAVIYCLFAAGPVFGFAAIKPVLIREGVYRDLCTREELERGFGLCYGQETRLNLMFTIAAVGTNICALPAGTALDTYGPRVCGVLGSFLLGIGTVLFVIGSKVSFDTYIPGYLFLALGGSFVFISSFQLSNAFPTRSGLILSLLTGAFDASSALFLVFRLVNEQTDGGFTVQKFFTLYLVIPVFIFIAQVTVMPGTSYKTAGELVLQAEENIAAEANDMVDTSIADHGEAERQRDERRDHRQSVVSNIKGLLEEGTDDRVIDTGVFNGETPEHVNHGGAAPERVSGKGDLTSPAKGDTKHIVGGVWGAMHGVSAFQQIRSPWFILITLFTVLQMLRINYFVATIRSQYDYLLGSPELSRQLNEAFDLALPVGGLIAIPFIGTILDSAGTPLVLFTLVAVSTAIGILGCIPGSIGAGYANIVLFVVYRPFYYTTVSDYVAKVFGFRTFGKVYGLIIALAGICNFVQTGLDALTFKAFARNPIPVNIMLTVAVLVVGFLLVTFVATKARALTLTQGQAEVLAAEQQPLIGRVENGRQNGTTYGTA
ncbi:putative MFS transporter Fmp42 [Talaromyces proteolyticus]|uniref:MFS transporter Fmp42 n=1 Tax=Talaromyces proteolyticus TaxID=1131652 RepID=A0AAD4KE22_9EURO|nr:putative MFS transporter Fmp42 [Talaromyces proteolyticus]KAH8690047.1 putative MFS transporter Fmp42 [Talaromyces proteolyticus]